MTNLIQLSKEFCLEYHKGQFRKGSNQPYSTHPFAVSELLAKYGYNDVVSQCIGNLHDVGEDSGIDVGKMLREIEKRFNYDIQEGVYILSKNTIDDRTRTNLKRVLPGWINVDELSDDQLYKLRLSFARPKIKRAKISDVTCNTTDLVNLKPEGIISKLFDSRDIYIPMGREIAPIMVRELEQNISNFFEKTNTTWNDYSRD